jgi:hypothetical protein
MADRASPIRVSNSCNEATAMESDKPQSGLISYGPDHPRLGSEGKQIFGGAVFIILLVVVLVGLWKQVQAQRKPHRRRPASVKRVDLMAAVKQRDDGQQPKDEAGKVD